MIDSEFYNKNFGGYFQYSSPVDRGDDEWKYSINSLSTRNLWLI